jgi:hypothetical protein
MLSKGRLADPLFVLFFVSGFSGLIYESVWSHYVKLFLGHAAYAQTLVLVVFIGGLALGSWLCARFAAGNREPAARVCPDRGRDRRGRARLPLDLRGDDRMGLLDAAPATCEQASAFCAGQWVSRR